MNIEIIQIESREHARQLAKEGGFDVSKAMDRMAEYFDFLLKQKNKSLKNP